MDAGSARSLMALLQRALLIAWLVLGGLLSYCASRLRAGSLTSRELELLRGRTLASVLQRLGATYVKFGQILSTRPDLLGPGYIEALACLQDNVAPEPFLAVIKVLQEELGESLAAIRNMDQEPIAAASVAQVHRAELTDGREVALKIQRPRARAQIEQDLALMRLGARVLDWLPSLHLLSLPGAVREFGRSLRAQVDFRLEAENNRRFARNFAGSDDVRVPSLVQDLCSERVLTMEFVHGVKASSPERVGGDRKRLARIGAETVLNMIFRDGFVHADLHPGNVLLTPDGKIVLIDLGMVAEIPAEMVRPWVETNLALAQQDGRRAAHLFYAYAPSVGTRDYERYEDDVDAYFKSLHGKSFGEVEVSEVVGGIMNILRRHRVQIDPVFTVVNVAMLVAEGLGKQLDPDVDMVALSRPYLFQSLLTAPAGKPQVRTRPPQTQGAPA